MNSNVFLGAFDDFGDEEVLIIPPAFCFDYAFDLFPKHKEVYLEIIGEPENRWTLKQDVSK